jgi:signal transduction histidine kinase
MVTSVVAETTGLNQNKGDLEEILSLGRPKRGLGLKSMRERTEFSSGSFSIESEKGLGPILK